LKSILHQNKIFIVLYALVFCAALLIIFSTDKLQLHLFFNRLVGSPLDNFFSHVTFIGDGIFIILFALLLLLDNVQKALTILLCYLISAGVTQGLKYGFFGYVDRPILEFAHHNISLQVVEGVDLNIHHSFPSGHATAAFSLFFCLSFFSKNNRTKVICFLAAVTVAFSRVYLSQHFFEDITAGSFMGVLFSWIVCAVLFKTKMAEKFNSLQKPIWKLF
jgi:membrane-associated phospholipid phosphatase